MEISRTGKPPRLNSEKGWIEKELAGCVFKDARLGKRFKNLVKQLSDRIGETIPLVCQDWASTKAAYRFLSNERVSEDDILEGHFQSTRDRFIKTDGTVLVLQDTTEFTYSRQKPHLIGATTTTQTSKYKDGRPKKYRVCGILMHSSLAVTTEGLPLGLSAIKFWTRKKFKGTNVLRKKINPTRVPIEKKESVRWLENLKKTTVLFNDPARCVHIGDRESDIYELFCTAQEVGTHFLVRTCSDRLAGDGKHRVSAEMDEVKVKGLHRIQVRNKKGDMSEAILEIKYRRIRVCPPIGKQDRYPRLDLTVIHARERGRPKGRDRIIWKLITDLSIESRKDAIEKLQWYAMRWKIETFHKILKSGCKAEESRLRTADRLVNLIATFCIVGWRVFWMTMINRAAPRASPKIALTQLEIRLLDKLVANPNKKNPEKKLLSAYLTKIAKLGGYLDRASDPPPGNAVVWRGMSRLTDIELGFLLGESCG